MFFIKFFSGSKFKKKLSFAKVLLLKLMTMENKQQKGIF